MVPTICPLSVAPCCDDEAMPKSMMSAWPSAVTITFSGFMSRCTTPTSCAAAMPSAICRASASVSVTGIGPCRPMRAASVSPATYDIVMYFSPLTSPRSWMRTTFLCVTWRASSSSLLKRLTWSRSVCSSAASACRIVLMATATPSSSS